MHNDLNNGNARTLHVEEEFRKGQTNKIKYIIMHIYVRIHYYGMYRSARLDCIVASRKISSMLLEQY